MPLVKREAIVAHSVSDMYNLVNNIEDYPEFLPWCESSKVLERTDDEIKATLVLAKGGLRKSFTTCNRLQKDKMIEVKLVSGPFKHLEGFWLFEAVDDNKTQVSLHLEFEFANKLISMAIGPVFHQVANTMLDAFCSRANALQLKGTKREG